MRHSVPLAQCYGLQHLMYLVASCQESIKEHPTGRKEGCSLHSLKQNKKSFKLHYAIPFNYGRKHFPSPHLKTQNLSEQESFDSENITWEHLYGLQCKAAGASLVLREYSYRSPWSLLLALDKALAGFVVNRSKMYTNVVLVQWRENNAGCCG